MALQDTLELQRRFSRGQHIDRKPPQKRHKQQREEKKEKSQETNQRVSLGKSHLPVHSAVRLGSTPPHNTTVLFTVAGLVSSSRMQPPPPGAPHLQGLTKSSATSPPSALLTKKPARQPRLILGKGADTRNALSCR